MDFTSLNNQHSDLNNPVFSRIKAKRIDLENPDLASDGFNKQDFANKVAASVNHNASDLHLCTGFHPVLRIDGELKPLLTGRRSLLVG